ncbi:hypothetical protein [Sandarakinorhabdus rubra]|uniref:hypothetical protein n=1 Tax=Sandarakinorhabdus rubra TaxID=2672568 RepID=UPI0013D94BA5|nr:hypothetical protein [Sandarakinorhabdus rubra]
MMGRPALALALWLALTAATSPSSLMPDAGTRPVFGLKAMLRLTEAEDNRRLRIGQPPHLDRNSSFLWRVRWTGRAYEVRDRNTSDNEAPIALMRLRPIGSDRHLMVLELVEPDAIDGPRFDYGLLWRRSARSHIGYLQLGRSECDALGADSGAALGLTSDDFATCTMRSWPQVEALMRAFAATNPPPLGVMRWLRGAPR